MRGKETNRNLKRFFLAYPKCKTNTDQYVLSSALIIHQLITYQPRGEFNLFDTQPNKRI